MEIKLNVDGGTAVLDVSGEVIVQNAPQLRAAVQKQLKAGAKKILIRLADVKYMDSSGVGILVSSLKLSKEKSVAFGLVEVAKPVMDVIKVTRLTRIFTIYPDLPVALAQS